VVLYLAGSGRSGTTLISHILDQLDGVFAGGELRYVWERGLGQDNFCGCGCRFSACPFWTAVMAEVQRCSGVRVVATGDAVGRRLLTRLRILRVPAMVLRLARRRPPVPHHPDDLLIASLYQAIANVTGARVIVDSSKLPPYGMLLSQQPDLIMSVLHVVRDSRATAFSWRRPRRALEGDDSALMPQFDWWKSSLLWLWWNFVTLAVWDRRDSRYLRIRYEDFADNAGAAMSDVARFIGTDPADLPFVSASSVLLSPSHFVAGNPNRHATGPTEILPDTEWRDAMTTRDMVLVTAVTALGLVRFGYPLGRGR
jgi:hypothetical protein